MLFLHKTVLCLMSFLFCVSLLASESDLEMQQEVCISAHQDFMQYAKATSIMGLTSGVASLLSFNNYLTEFEDGQNPMASRWFRSSALLVTFSTACVGLSLYSLSQHCLSKVQQKGS